MMKVIGITCAEKMRINNFVNVIYLYTIVHSANWWGRALSVCMLFLRISFYAVI